MNVDVNDPGVLLLVVVSIVVDEEGSDDGFIECPFEGFSVRNTSEVFGTIRE